MNQLTTSIPTILVWRVLSLWKHFQEGFIGTESSVCFIWLWMPSGTKGETFSNVPIRWLHHGLGVDR